MGSVQPRRWDGKPLVEDCLTIDLAWLMRLAPIHHGQVGSGEIFWRADGAAVRSGKFCLDLRCIDNAHLTIRSQTVTQTIVLVALPQHFGGYRWWFRCPITGERARTLHLPPGGSGFASRKAWGLAYSVERLARFDRPFEKLFRAQRRLGGVHGLAVELKRPKGMWQRTFARHVVIAQQHDLSCLNEVAKLFT